MGIKYLNYYLQKNCESAITQINLSELTGKTIVVDASIYLYRYIGDNVLLENFYLMISVFREYNITPIFVFDGKPPKEKFKTLIERKKIKDEAEIKYNELKDKLLITDEVNKNELIQEMENLKKNFIRIHHSDIENVKLLIQSYGVSYIDANGEADKLCAVLVLNNTAYACLSEDMDLFVYGCTRVIRYLSLFKKTAVMYDFKLILNNLNMTLNDFRIICIISGTDYNNSDITLYNSISYYNKYKNSECKNFKEWLFNNNLIDIDKLNLILNLFEIYDINKEFNPYKNLILFNGPINKSNLKDIMKKENFLFI